MLSHFLFLALALLSPALFVSEQVVLPDVPALLETVYPAGHANVGPGLATPLEEKLGSIQAPYPSTLQVKEEPDDPVEFMKAKKIHQEGRVLNAPHPVESQGRSVIDSTDPNPVCQRKAETNADGTLFLGQTPHFDPADASSAQPTGQVRSSLRAQRQGVSLFSMSPSFSDKLLYFWVAGTVLIVASPFGVLLCYLLGVEVMTESIPVVIAYIWAYFSLALFFDLTCSIRFHLFSLVVIAFALSRRKQAREAARSVEISPGSSDGRLRHVTVNKE